MTDYYLRDKDIQSSPCLSTRALHGTIELSACDSFDWAEKLSLFDETLKQVVLCYRLIYISSFPCFTVTDD